MSGSVRGTSAGFTLVEVMIVCALLGPLLIVVGLASRAVFGSVEADTRAGATTEDTVRALADLERVLVFGRLSTVKVQATKDDVKLKRALNEGDWFAMPQLEPRSEIQLSCLTGERQLALDIPSKAYRFAFVPDAKEWPNGLDDDGDGLVDEGALQMTRDGVTTPVLDGVEACEFELDGRVLRVTLSLGRRVHGRNVRRSQIQHTLFLHND